jgi:hypothetical protein
MWPWQAFDWDVFWAIMAAAFVCFVVANLINLFLSRMNERPSAVVFLFI